MPDTARFIVVEGSKLEAGDLVCIDLANGKLRKASIADRNQFCVPHDAWQENGNLFIPTLRDRSPVHY